jgi:predicted RNA methylase
MTQRSDISTRIQLDLFKESPLKDEVFDYGTGEIKEPSECIQPSGTPICDKIMSFLDKMNKEVEQQNIELKAMIDELQADWSEEDKLQINNPKEYARQQALKIKETENNTPMPEVTADVIESIKKCRVVGNTLHLPPISEGTLSNYDKVRQALLNAGAKYKKNTFIFSSDAQPFIDQLTSGESVNIKKEFQFFATPDDLADWIVSFANLQESDNILEPSAGQGAIVNAILRANEHALIECCELMPENADILMKAGHKVIGNNFLEITDRKSSYDKIIANPPFSKNQDIEHIYKMWECLKPGGRIVTIASKHWQFSSNKKEKAFREWVALNGVYQDIPAGEFKESGTMVSTCLVILNKTL